MGIIRPFSPPSQFDTRPPPLPRRLQRFDPHPSPPPSARAGLPSEGLARVHEEVFVPRWAAALAGVRPGMAGHTALVDAFCAAQRGEEAAPGDALLM